jgi:hypothetical protein
MNETATALTPLDKLLCTVLANEPGPGHSGVAYFRAWADALSPGVPEAEGPGDDLSVCWSDGEFCVCLSELVRWLRARERSAGDRGATECHLELVRTLCTFLLMARDGLFPG